MALDELRQWLDSLGFRVPEIRLDGKPVRFAVNCRDKNGWFFGWQNFTKSGKEFVCATVGNWATGEKHEYKSNGNYDEKEQEEIRQYQEQARRERETERAREQEAAAEEAQRLYSQSHWEIEGHPYLLRKRLLDRAKDGFKPHIRQLEDALLIPIGDVEGGLWGLERIYPDGTKLFLPGNRIKGCYNRIGEIAGGILTIAEGYATGYSAHLATAWPCFVAFYASNLLPVAQAIRKKYPDHRIVILGDDDRFTVVNGKPKNVGREAAIEAAKAIGGRAVFPDFGDGPATHGDNGQVFPGGMDQEGGGPYPKDKGPTDWNDLHCLRGLDEVKRQLIERVWESQEGREKSAAPSPASKGEPILPEVRAKSVKDYTPLNVATLFLYENALIQDRSVRLRYWNQDFYVYRTDHYELVHEDEMTGILQAWLTQTGRGDLVGGKKVEGAIKSMKMTPFMISRNVPWPHLIGSDRGRLLIPLKNGLLDIENWTEGDDSLLPHSPEFLSTLCLPFEYQRGATCPLYDRVALEILGTKEAVELWDEIMGVHFYQPQSLEKFFILWGEGRNGKSILLRVLRDLLDDKNVSSVSLESFKHDSFMLYQTVGKLANIISDLPAIEKTDEGLIKRYVTREPITFNRKFKEPMTCTPTALLTIACNILPVISDRSDAIWSRMIALEFKNQVLDEGKQDKRLISQGFWAGAGELPGIFNRALAGLGRVMRRGHILEPADSLRFKEQYRYEMNPVAQFIEECLELDAGAQETVDAVYSSYVAWCKATGQMSRKQQTFTKDLIKTAGRRGAKIERSSPRRVDNFYGRFFHGVRLIAKSAQLPL